MLNEIEKHYRKSNHRTNLYMILIIAGMLLGIAKDALFNYYFFCIPATIVILTCGIYLSMPYTYKAKSLSKLIFYYILLANLFYYLLLFRFESALFLLIPMTLSIGIYFNFTRDKRLILSIFIFMVGLITAYIITDIQIISLPVSANYKHLTDIANYTVLILWTIFSLYISFKLTKQTMVYNNQIKKIIENGPSKLSGEEALQELHYLIENDYTAFYIKFKQLYPLFMHQLELIAPNVVVEEMKVIILIFLGYSTKQIAERTNSSNSSVEAKKHRIRKKLFVSSETTLPEFLKKMQIH